MIDDDDAWWDDIGRDVRTKRAESERNARTEAPAPPPRCIACGSSGRLAQVAIGGATAVFVHSSCERVYSGSSLSLSGTFSVPFRDTRRGAHFAHPLLQHRLGGHIIGYIRDARTDGQGWMRRTLPEST